MDAPKMDLPTNNKQENSTITKTLIKQQSFDKSMRILISESQEIIKQRYGDIASSNRNELMFLNRYLSIYDQTEPKEHYRYFEMLFGKHRTEILKTSESDAWIRQGIAIQFGEGTRSTSLEAEERKKQVRIMLSEIYDMACFLKDQANKVFDEIDESFTKINNKDLIRPDILMLHLFRIFYYLNEGDDKRQVGVILTKIEDELSIQVKTVTKEPPVSSGQSTNALGSLYNMAADVMKKMGHEPPAGMTPPSDEQLNSVINSVFQNENTQNAINSVLSSLKGCNDFGSALQQVIKTVGDPETIQAFQGSISETVKSAMENKDIPPK